MLKSPLPCLRKAACMICGLQRAGGNKDGPEIGVPGSNEWIHGHWQGLGNRTSVGEREMASTGHDAGGLGAGLHLLAPQGIHCLLRPVPRLVTEFRGWLVCATGTASCPYMPVGLPSPHPLPTPHLDSCLHFSGVRPCFSHPRMGIPFIGQHLEGSLLRGALCGLPPGSG